MKRILSILAFSLLAALSAVSAEPQTKVLCSTYPIYQLARNVAEGSKLISLELLVPPNAGCPHDYSLTPQDMKKIASANAMVVNGLKMEGFLGEPVKKANASIIVIDSSTGIKDTLEYSGEEIDHDAAKKEEDDEHNGVNPHLFASPKMAAKIVLNIAGGLSKLDPKEAPLFAKNAKAYSERLEKLGAEMAVLGKSLKNPKIVTEHGVFDYLARDMGLQVAGVIRAYEEEGQAPSAAAIIRIAKLIKERKVGAIFTEPQYPDEIGRTISGEAKVPVAKLDPVASGPESAPLDYYETAMRKNMDVLKSTLGVK